MGAPLPDRPANSAPKALLVSSGGGHILQLYRLRPWWEHVQRQWVTWDKIDTRSILAGEEIAGWAYHPTTRNLWNLIRNTALAWRVLRSWRPDVVISSGAGVAVPFFAVAKLLRIKTVYLEVYDRIDLPTMTGRLCHPMSDLFLLQWADQARFYPKGELIGRLL
jgi:UDP-N-acetylglucosamine:LPS N-acetylglucosamine transferase